MFSRIGVTIVLDKTSYYNFPGYTGVSTSTSTSTVLIAVGSSVHSFAMCGATSVGLDSSMDLG